MRRKWKVRERRKTKENSLFDLPERTTMNIQEMSEENSEIVWRQKEDEEEEMECSQFYGVTVDEYEAIDFAHRVQTQEMYQIKSWEMEARVAEMDRMYAIMKRKIEELKRLNEAKDRLITSQLEEIQVLQQQTLEANHALDEKLEYEEYLLGVIFEFEHSG